VDTEKDKEQDSRPDDLPVLLPFSRFRRPPAAAKFLRNESSLEEPCGIPPLPEEMLGHRRKRENLMKKPPLSATTSPASEESSGEPVDKQGPKLFIGPANPDHPRVNRKPGSRDPT
jgi:hypothetical protein